MPITDEELAKKAKLIQDRRAKLAKLQETRVAREQAMTNELASAQMDAELARLDAEIEVESERSKAGAVKAGISNTMETATALMAHASGKPPVTEKKE